MIYDYERHEYVQSCAPRDRVIRSCEQMRDYIYENRAIERCHTLVVHSCERIDANTMHPSKSRKFRYYRVVYQFTFIDETSQRLRDHRALFDVANRRSLRDAPLSLLFPK